MESDLDPESPSSPWMIEGQKILLGAGEEELSHLTVTDIVVPFSDLGDFKKALEYITRAEKIADELFQTREHEQFVYIWLTKVEES